MIGNVFAMAITVNDGAPIVGGDALVREQREVDNLERFCKIGCEVQWRPPRGASRSRRRNHLTMAISPPDSGTLASVASVIAAFGSAMIFFRVQREISMEEEEEINWIPWADWLLVIATWTCLILVIVPLMLLDPASRVFRVVPAAACAAAAVMVAGYPLAILAHYRFLFARGRTGPRTNPEPAERLIVITAFALAVIAFAFGVEVR